MAILIWKHGTTRSEARQAIMTELHRLGYANKVTWNDDRAKASVGFGAILYASGEITDDAVVVEKCGGAAGGLVLQKCRELLESLFPGGSIA